MCTSIIFINRSSKWPVIIGSNRDERLNREWKFPARHWFNKYSNIIAGKDEKKGGSWIGVNDSNLVSLIHNRKTKKLKKSTSRGNIILDVLKHTEINSSLNYIKKINRLKYNNFNLLISNSKKTFWIKHDLDNEKLYIEELREGLSILTENELNNTNDKKINYYLDRFSKIETPNPTKNNWKEWKKTLTYQNDKNIDNHKNICLINKAFNYGTKSSSLIAIPDIKQTNEKLVFKSTKTFPTAYNYKDVKF